jgi:hypothetical protein
MSEIKGRSLKCSEDEEHILRRLGGALVMQMGCGAGRLARTIT